MRLTLPEYNPVRECSGCTMRDERSISAHILSYQIAARLLMRYPGSWEIRKNELRLDLEGLDSPIVIDVNHGNIHYKTLSASLNARYDADKGLRAMTDDICLDLGLPQSEGAEGRLDKMFTLFVKLIEIFHARCGLRIVPSEEVNGWELRLHEDGAYAWIGKDGLAENRYGETVNISKWDHLRPEKIATYLFGFNRFCRNFPSPLAQDK